MTVSDICPITKAALNDFKNEKGAPAPDICFVSVILRANGDISVQSSDYTGNVYDENGYSIQCNGYFPGKKKKESFPVTPLQLATNRFGASGVREFNYHVVAGQEVTSTKWCLLSQKESTILKCKQSIQDCMQLIFNDVKRQLNGINDEIKKDASNGYSM